jgi:predicted dehydrogenase
VGERVRVGIVGCGLVAQVMHLPYLRELDELFELVAVCDLSRTRAEAVGDAYGVPLRFTRWEDLVAAPLDVVMVLISGSHAPILEAAIAAGRHVFSEKPLCLSVAEGRDLDRQAKDAGVRLMVGYMKRYDPAYERLRDELPSLGELRHVRLTTLESPLEPYVAHYPFVQGEPLPSAVLAELRADDAQRVRRAVGDVDPEVARVYREWLLDSMVHELNAVRGLLGEPDRIEYAAIRPGGVTVVMRFGSLECVATWLNLPGMSGYRQEWAFVADERRALLEFPSPFLRSAPTTLRFEDGQRGSPASSRTDHVAGYDEAFKRELRELHRSITEGRAPRTTADDALRDIALCEAIVRAHVTGRPVDAPTTIQQA